MPHLIVDDYRQKVAAAQQQIAKYEKLVNTFSLLRLLVSGMMAVAIGIGVKFDNFTIIISSFIVLALMFATLVSRQSGFILQKQYFENYKAVNENEIKSIMHHQTLYSNGSQFADDKHLYASDLDIFGTGSLYQLSNRAATSGGAAQLARWFAEPSTKSAIELRQKAVKELAENNDWKLDTQARLVFSLQQSEQELPRLFTFLQYPLTIKGERWLRRYAMLVPYVIVLALILAIKLPIAKEIAVCLLLLNGALTFWYAGLTKKTDLIAGKIVNTLNSYAKVFSNIEQQRWHTEFTITLAAKLKDRQGASVSSAVEHLGKLINKLNVNANLIVSFVLNALSIWNIRQVIAIEEWKRTNQTNLESAFAVLAEFEALLSLAGLAINYPDWCFPVITQGEAYTLVAQNIAHPLIPEAQRVENDYSLADAYRIDLITGSNMAGKSTFLRTLGINTVLALCGAPICATAMEVSVMQLFTYMRIKDSLNESTSTFKAELDRLQLLLKTVEQPNKVFFLIDEMLRGTNSVDKYLGSKAVIERLIAQQGVGLVATHDLQLAELEQQYPDYIRNFYFDIQVINGEMRFDYKLKPGECKTFNASLLLKQIGIDVDKI